MRRGAQSPWRSGRWTLGACVAATVLACSPPSAEQGSGGGDSSSTSSDDRTTTEHGTTAADDTSDDDGFILSYPDFGPPPGEPGECSFGDDHCPSGYKCVPRSTAESPHYNVCAPVVPDPVSPAETCTRQPTMPDMPVDDCDASHYCLVTDSETQTGTCMILCGLEEGLGGPPPDPTACHSSQSCQQFGEILHVCFDHCDPLVQDCPDGWGCYGIQAEAMCVPNWQAVPQGEPCSYINDCAPGLACISSLYVPDCAMASGCCAPYCDTSLRDDCDTVMPGTICLSWWYEEIEPTEGLEDLGVCALPEEA